MDQKKAKIEDIHRRIKEWAAAYGDEELGTLLFEMDTVLDETEDDTGGSTPPGNKERPDKP